MDWHGFLTGIVFSILVIAGTFWGHAYYWRDKS